MKYKFNEENILKEIKEYIDSTYKAHYSTGGIQVNEFLVSLGIAKDGFVCNAIEYLSRYGKKEGKNKKDLLKAIHNIMLLIDAEFKDNPTL